MRKRTISAMAAVFVLTTTVTAFASSDPIMFGDNVQRTHENGINDGFPWSKEVFLGSGATGGISMASSSTAIGAGNIMYYPVSAGDESNNFQGTGYMTTWNMVKWSWDSHTSQEEPTMLNEVQIPDVSNSSPVYVGGYAYLAAGGTLYKFDSTGNIVNTADISTGGTWEKLVGGSLVATPSTSNTSPTDVNQVVSYPLFVSSSQAGTPNNEIWVSSQNGNLYSVDPTTLGIIGTVHLGVRLDASPALVTATDGTHYIAVTAAYSPNNKIYGGQSGTGMLFLVNPITGAQYYLPNPYNGSTVSPTPSVASPVSLDPRVDGGTPAISGGIMWNDTNGDVFLGIVNSNGTVTYDHQWDNTGNGQTSDFSESGFSSTYDQYIVPFTDGGTYGYATVNPKTYDVKQISVAGSSGPIKAFGSPEISASGSLYLADTVGGIDQIAATSSGGFGVPSSSSAYLASQGSSSGTTLSTPSELMLDTKGGATEPTLTLATSQGLELWVNGGEYLTFDSSYTSTSTASFSLPLTLKETSGNLPTDSSNTDKIDFNMIVNGGAQKDNVGSVATYNASGNPITGAMTISTSTLNSMLKAYEFAYPIAWNNSSQNNVVIRAYSPSSNAENYVFQGANATPDGTNAEVAVTFPAASSSYTPPSTYNSCGNTSTQNGSCTDGMVYHEIMRFIYPGYLHGHEYEKIDYPFGAVPANPINKVHTMAEQLINGTPAAATNNVNGKIWSNDISTELVNGYGKLTKFTLQGELSTAGDVKYTKKYIASWTPNWNEEWRSYACGLSTCESPYWVFTGYTPNYQTETLYRNFPVNEVATQSFVQPNGSTELWDPTNIHVTVEGSFTNPEDTPDEPLSWTQNVFAVYGAWIPPDKVYQDETSQNGNLNGTATPPALGTWFSDAPMPTTPNPSVVYSPPSTAPVGSPVPHSEDFGHNYGHLFEPVASLSPFPALNVPRWTVEYVVTATSGQGVFNHNSISVWVPTWKSSWFNSSGELVPTTMKLSGGWYWSSTPTK